jgi:hypothetical protein
MVVFMGGMMLGPRYRAVTAPVISQGLPGSCRTLDRAGAGAYEEGMATPELDEISRRLLRLHRSLLDEQRREHERTYGPVDRGHLLRLLLEDEGFAWLRPLSALIARIDEALGTTRAVAGSELDGLLEDARRLFRPTGEGSPFTRRYHETLQRSPEVAMDHAAVMRVLGPFAKP